MGLILANNAATTVPGALSSTATSLTVTSGTGALFPILGSGDFFYATIQSITNAFEVVKVTARADDTMTIVRGQEGTLAIPFPANSRFELRVTAKNITDLVVHNLGISPGEFGAQGDGVADDTAALKATFDYAMPRGLTVILKGTYLVSDYISSFTTFASADLHIICEGNVRINVSGSATPFTGLLYCQSTAANNVSITGGSLTIDANNKTGEVIYIRHYAASQGGQVSLTCPVTVLNAKQAANDMSETAGITVIGDYASVVMVQPTVKNVSRINPAAACAGITIAGFSGDVALYSPRTENILTAGTAAVPSGADADGIKVFGKGNVPANARTEGRAVIYSPILIDCQGRGFKSQCSDTTVIRPYIKHQMVVVMNNGHDFDFQKGNGLVVEPEFEYRLNGATSPIAPGNSFTPVSFQQNITGFPMYAKCTGGVLKTECELRQFGYAFHNVGGSLIAGDSYAETEFDGLRVEHIGSFTGNVFSRCVIETAMAPIVDKTTETKLIVRNISGPFNTSALGYTGYTSGDLSAKLTIEVTDIFATLDPSGANRTRVFQALSGNFITSIKSFIFRNINGLVPLADNGFPVDFRTLKAGSQFFVEIGDITQTNNPSWGSSGYALVECIADNFAKSPDEAFTRVIVSSGNFSETVFFTRNGGATWASSIRPDRTTSLGTEALNSTNMTGADNTAVGFRALQSNTSGGTNTAVGSQAVQGNTTGIQNTGVGHNAFQNSTTGSSNSAVGAFALRNNTTGNANTAVGLSALQNNTTGSDNTAVGTNALLSTTTANFNTAVGREALRYFDTANNTAVGAFALEGSTTVANNTGSTLTAFGYLALRRNTSGNNNVAISRALENNTTGSSNVAVGASALSANTTGSSNTAIGLNALLNTTTGLLNEAVGTNALRENVTGQLSTAVGSDALRRFVSAGNQVAIGHRALFGGDATPANNTGANNIAIGYQAGDAITTGSTNLVIGYNIDVDSATANNQINIADRYFHDRIRLLERTSDPAKPAEGNMIVWMSDGTGLGDDGDIIIASTAGGVTNYAILFDHSAGTLWP